MFLGCSPCCGVCPNYSFNSQNIVNAYFDLTARASSGAFVDNLGVSHPAADSGLITAADWMFPGSQSLINSSLSDIPFYDFTQDGFSYTGSLYFDFRVQTGFPTPLAAIQHTGSLGFGFFPGIQPPPGALQPHNPFPGYTSLIFSPCEVYYKDDDNSATDPPSGRRQRTFDLIAETLSTRSRYNFSTPTAFVDASTDFTLSAGAVSIDETLQDTNNWLSQSGSPYICHRFSGTSDKSISVMDGTTPLEATWTFNDISYGGGDFNSFIELTIREFFIEFADGTVENALPWWTNSLATFTE